MTNRNFSRIDGLFDEIGYGVSSEDGDVSFTCDTIENVLAARQNYADPGKLSQGYVDGRRYIEIRGAQVAKGQPRRDVVAIEIDGELAIHQ